MAILGVILLLLLTIPITVTSAAESDQAATVCPAPNAYFCDLGAEFDNERMQYFILEGLKAGLGCITYTAPGTGRKTYTYSYCRNGDINSEECKWCLEQAAKVIGDNCKNKPGGQYTMFEGNCCVRYESSEFCKKS